MTFTYTLKLDFQVQKNNVKAQKIYKSSLVIYKIVIVVFQVYNNLKHFLFFQKTFYLANINVSTILKIIFLFFSNINIIFVN